MKIRAYKPLIPCIGFTVGYNPDPACDWWLHINITVFYAINIELNRTNKI